jgi:fumarate hydratase class I
MFGDREILKIDPKALTLLTNEAIKAVSFKLRTSHLEQVASILDDPGSYRKRPYGRANAP